jgi:hypothetical protein
MNQENKHTAVEYIFHNFYNEDNVSIHVLRIFKEAFLMEKKQIEEAFEHIDFNLDNGEHYYEKMYNSQYNRIKKNESGK